MPLVVEIKSEGRYARTTALTCETLEEYRGLYCVESFHPMVLRRYKRLSPGTLLGQLASNFLKEDVAQPLPVKLLLTNLLLNFLSRPDFIAYDRQYLDQPSFRLCMRLFRPVGFAWTVKSAEQLRECRERCDAFIFEGFDPRAAEKTEQEGRA